MTSAPVSIRPMGGILGGEMLAVDPSSPPEVTGAAVAHALAEYGLLVCQEGMISREAEAKLLGLFTADAEFHCAASGGLAPARFAGNMDPAWRSDRPAILFLRAVQLPPGGGESIWSSLQAAYRSLSVPMRRYLAPLHAGHGRSGHAQVWRPLVAPHPVTGIACLDFSPDFTRSIAGVPEEEAQLILKLLCDHVYTPENQVRIPWREGMFVLWDVRIAHHYPVGGFAAAGWRLSALSAPRAPGA